MDPFNLSGYKLANSPFKFIKSIDNTGCSSCIYQLSNMDRIAKVIKLNNYTNFYTINVKDEYLIQDIAYTLGVAPEPISYRICLYDNIKYAVIEMEYLKGYNFTKICEKFIDCEISEETFRLLQNKIYDSLNILYNNGIKHSDLHSENFIIGEEMDWVKIIDYGISTKQQYSIPHLERDFNIKIVLDLPLKIYIDVSKGSSSKKGLSKIRKFKNMTTCQRAKYFREYKKCKKK